jgi:hypothetical protein
MYASAFQYPSEHEAEAAFDIAWQFIKITHDVADEFVAQAFIASEIMRLMARGDRHKILLANRAIAAYERAHPEDIDHLLALGYVSRR